MINKQNIEKMFDYLDAVAILLYETDKTDYLTGLNEASNYLLDGEFGSEYDEAILVQVQTYKEKITDVSFQNEEVRKAMQLCLLRGYKHANLTNALMTPDTIGLFISYLVKKLYANKEITTILDPLIGTGNLIYTVLNNIEHDVKAFGIDNDILKCKLSRNLGDMMDVENEVFFQDTLTYFDYGFDLIVTNTDNEPQEEGYFPYKVINHHMDALSDGGYFISIIDNDFFEQEKNQVFKEEISKKGQIFGLIKLSETLFKSNPKSILIIKKKGKQIVKQNDFLLVDLPSFTELERFNETMKQIEAWFLKREDVL